MDRVTEVERRISPQRIAQRISQLAGIGGLPGGGVNRLPFTVEDGEARALFTEWLRDADLAAWVDGAGNIIGRAEGTNPQAPAVMIGSHLDSQPSSGRFDGVAGVVAALEVVEAMCEAAYRHRHAIEVVDFSGEEAGTRFDVSMIGSRAMVGGVAPQELEMRCRLTGMTLREAMASLGINVTALAHSERPAGSVKAVVELHVEQGPYLERWGKPVGVVTEVAGAIRLTCIMHGQQAHSGGMPMNERRDPLAGAAEVVLAVERLAKSRNNPPVVATVAYLDSHPRAVAVIPRTVRMIIDVRSTSQQARDEVREEIVVAARSVAAKRRLTLEWGPAWGGAPVRFDPEIIGAIEGACRNLGVPFVRMFSGGGHDAMTLSRRFPAGMIFVPSVGGVSHAPEELTRIEDLEIGTRVFCRTACRLCA